MAEFIEWRPASLRATRDLAPDIRLFDIDPAEPMPSPAPGSHIHIAVQVAGRPDLRSYTVVGPAPGGGYQIAVKRLSQGRGGGAYLWGLQPGARLMITPPRNRFPLAPGRPDYLLVAGGIGITPLVGMALALAAGGARFRLLYGVGHRADAAFADTLGQRIGDRLDVHVSGEGRRVDLPAAIARLAPGGEAYVCGPIGLLDSAKRAWTASGRPVDGLRFETFGSSGRYAAEPFTVHLPRLGLSIAVRANQTLLSALEAAGVAVIHDCRRGECGLCALPIIGIDGVLDHRDVFFSDAEKAANAKLCTCVTRVVGGSITLDTGLR